MFDLFVVTEASHTVYNETTITTHDRQSTISAHKLTQSLYLSFRATLGQNHE